jgi:PAP2 superfamily
VPPGRARVAWGGAAMGFSVLMALSRAYLGAHWLSDAIAGVLLGASCALLAALAVTGLQHRRTTEKPDRSAHPPVTDTARPADRRSATTCSRGCGRRWAHCTGPGSLTARCGLPT